MSEQLPSGRPVATPSSSKRSAISQGVRIGAWSGWLTAIVFDLITSAHYRGFRDFTEESPWTSLYLMCVMAITTGLPVGCVYGLVVSLIAGRLIKKDDIARSVTTTAVIALCLATGGMLYVYRMGRISAGQ